MKRRAGSVRNKGNGSGLRAGRHGAPATRRFSLGGGLLDGITRSENGHCASTIFLLGTPAMGPFGYPIFFSKPPFRAGGVGHAGCFRHLHPERRLMSGVGRRMGGALSSRQAQVCVAVVSGVLWTDNEGKDKVVGRVGGLHDHGWDGTDRFLSSNARVTPCPSQHQTTPNLATTRTTPLQACRVSVLARHKSPPTNPPANQTQGIWKVPRRRRITACGRRLRFCPVSEVRRRKRSGTRFLSVLEVCRRWCGSWEGRSRPAGGNCGAGGRWAFCWRVGEGSGSGLVVAGGL